MSARLRFSSTVLAAAILAAPLLAGPGPAGAQDAKFGQKADVDDASNLWEQLVAARMAGESAIQTMPYEGTPPHGPMLGLLETDLEVDGHTGQVIVKRNFRPDGDLTREEILQGSADEYLASATVMFRREEGYAPDSGNWFWAKYNPDGSLQQTGQGTALAGRVQMCAACHETAPGGDYVFSYDLNQ